MNIVLTLALLLASPAPGPIQTVVPTPDSVAALSRARSLHPAVSGGDAATLWGEFDDRMRTAMKDSVSFASQMSRIHAQTGAIDSVLEEQLTRSGPDWLYQARCRFSGVPVICRLTIGITPDGRVSQLAVRPDERKAYPSPYLGYHTKTRLRLPFKGEWYVFWGGSSLEQNHHAASRSQRFAHDLAIMNEGATHSGDGSQLTDYYCYGKPVVAPAAGTIVWLEEHRPDQEIGTSDPAHPIGNGVIIDHGDGEFSVLAHLQPRSLKVKLGQKVKAGQTLGRCGNSGNTSEPHIHYHLQNGIDMREADGLPALFENLTVDGTRLDRAEIVRGQRVRPQ
jgi:hypothetical protein